MAKLKIPVGSEDHLQGPEAAEVVLVEYGDFQCPYCGEAYPIVKQVQKHFGSRLRFVFRNFPLGELHPYAHAAAETAEFAGANGKFWEMHDLLFEHQHQMSDQLFARLAQELELPVSALGRALEDGEFRKRVSDDFNGGVRSGVNGTPTFFINGLRHDGSYEFAALVAAIEEAARTHSR
ncbi:MAG TPA: DsbA family protein [Candidatus Krumholzibacteria bacterium]|nr:DsbA family protein [Candidatus Krumholzibacteria bacterium]